MGMGLLIRHSGRETNGSLLKGEAGQVKEES